MAKSKRKNVGVYNINLTRLSKILCFLIIGLGVLATVFILAPGLISQTDDIHTGLQITFGEKWFATDYVRQYIPFSILAFMGYFFPLGAAVLMVLNIDKENKWFDIASSVLLLASVILIALIPRYISFVKENEITATVTKALVEGKLGWGSQLTLAFSFVGTIASLLKWFSDAYEAK